MRPTNKIQIRLRGFFCFSALLLCCTFPAFSQYSFTDNDTAENNLLLPEAVADTKTIAIAASNIEFPEILKGNEEQASDYIEKFSEKRRDYLIRMYSKGKKLLPKAANILKRHNLPEELKVLMILESAYNANAVSRAGAVGYWQFMDAVAKEYGLKYIPKETREEKITIVKKTRRGKKIIIVKKEASKDIAKHGRGRKAKQIDERKNFDKATVAAARYLKDRKQNLDGNWLLVVASYNCGVGNVWDAMQRCKKQSPTFWDIKKYLPAETQAYVMNFIALNVVYKNYDKFLRNKLLFTPVKPGESPDSFEATISEELAGMNACN